MPGDQQQRPATSSENEQRKVHCYHIPSCTKWMHRCTRNMHWRKMLRNQAHAQGKSSLTVCKQRNVPHLQIKASRFDLLYFCTFYLCFSCQRKDDYGGASILQAQFRQERLGHHLFSALIFSPILIRDIYLFISIYFRFFLVRKYLSKFYPSRARFIIQPLGLG